MTFVSVAEAARRLGIDTKTVHRWLADAQLPLQGHPRDGRKKGLSGEHLHVLARLHQRSLASLPQEPPAPGPDAGPPLPQALLSLPEQLRALQAQFTALQQQVATLTRLLPQHPQPSACPAVRQTKKPTHPTAAGVQLPRKSAHVLPRVEYASKGHYVVICPKGGLLPLEPDTPEWFAWLTTQSAFRFVGQVGHFTAHHEWRVPRGAWRAHRKIRNHTSNLRLAATQELTIAVLEQAAASLQTHLR